MRESFILLFILACCAYGAKSQTQQNYKFVCYYPNWSFYRNNLGKYTIEDIDPFMCTHLIYAFAVLNEDTYELQIYDSYVDLELGYYEKFTALKAQNPQLKTLLALGGWNDSQFPKYSELIADPDKVSNFIDKVIPILDQYHFDGLDVDWEYPGPDDKGNFTNFIAALSDAFKPRGLLLTIASSASVKTVEEGYDVAALAQYLDLLNLMAYDFHGGTWEAEVVDHHAPLYERPYQTDDFDVDHGVQAWLDRGFPAEKIILGIPAYGRSWSLVDATNTTPPAPGKGAGKQGPYTGEDGYKSFYEISLDVRDNGWTLVQDPDHRMGPYAYGAGDWIGYDDIPMARHKTRYMKQKGLGGIMIWEVSLDDFRNLLGQGLNPFMNAIHAELFGPRPPQSTPSTTPTTTTLRPPVDCTTEGEVLPDPDNCHVYYVCLQGKPERFDCPDGTAYNPDIKACDFEENVPSCNNRK